MVGTTGEDVEVPFNLVNPLIDEVLVTEEIFKSVRDGTILVGTHKEDLRFGLLYRV